MMPTELLQGAIPMRSYAVTQLPYFVHQLLPGHLIEIVIHAIPQTDRKTSNSYRMVSDYHG